MMKAKTKGGVEWKKKLTSGTEKKELEKKRKERGRN